MDRTVPRSSVYHHSALMLINHTRTGCSTWNALLLWFGRGQGNVMPMKRFVLWCVMWLGACGHTDIPEGYGEFCDTHALRVLCAPGLICLQGSCEIPCDEESDCRRFRPLLMWTECEETPIDSGLQVVSTCTWATE